MGSKMPIALDAKNNRITVSMAENSDYEPPLRCEFCDALVSFVRASTRQHGDKIVPVTPFFRLKPKNVHSPECKYNVEGQLKIIVRESEPNILVRADSGKFELRLLAVKKALQELKELTEEKNKGYSNGPIEAKEKQYIKSGKRLGSYINSALRVLKVRAQCEGNTELESLLELNFEGVRVPWRDFYYDYDDYFRCYSNLRKAAITVPVAIKGVISLINLVKGKKGSLNVINLENSYRDTGKEDVRDSVNVSIWSYDLEAFKNYKIDDEIIAFGLWSTQSVSESPNKAANSPIKVYRNHKISLWPVSRAELCKVRS